MSETVDVPGSNNGEELRPPAVVVRVNPLNLRSRPRDSADMQAYAEGQDVARDRLKRAYAEQIRQAVESGELDLPVDEDDFWHCTPEQSVNTIAHRLAVRDLSLHSALSGMGMGIVDGFCFYGREIDWVPDEGVPYGGYMIDADDPGAVFDELRSLMS